MLLFFLFLVTIVGVGNTPSGGLQKLDPMKLPDNKEILSQLLQINSAYRNIFDYDDSIESGPNFLQSEDGQGEEFSNLGTLQSLNLSKMQFYCLLLFGGVIMMNLCAIMVGCCICCCSDYNDYKYIRHPQKYRWFFLWKLEKN